MDDPILQRAQLLLAAANDANAGIRSVMGHGVVSLSSSSNGESIQDTVYTEVVENFSQSPKSVQTIITEPKQIDDDEYSTDVSDVAKSDDICDDPILVRARLFIAAANSTSSRNLSFSNIVPKKIGSLSIIIPPPTGSISSVTKPAHKEAPVISPRRNKGDELNVKCSVIKGSSLISTSIDVRSHIKVGTYIMIDGLSYQVSSSISEWTASRIALHYDWPGDTMFDATLTVFCNTEKKSPIKKKNIAVPVPASEIQDAVCQLSDFLSSKLKVTPNGLSSRFKSSTVQIMKKTNKISPRNMSNKTDEYRNDLPLNATSPSNIRYLGYIESKIAATEDTIEASRQQALNRVSGKIKEEKEQARMEKEIKLQNQIVAQAVTERKTAELHQKTIERIAQRKDIERANKQRLLDLEEEQRIYDEKAHSKLDERIHKMDELRRKTLTR